MRDTLLDILAANSSPDSVHWLKKTIASQQNDFQKRPFYYSFSGVSRHFDKAAKVEAPESGFHGWDEFRVARVALLLLLAEQEKETFLETFFALLNTADLREQVALFSALPWMPHQEDLIEPAVDGLRSNIIDIFDSIALDNSFPAKHFTDEAWNQMVLKAIFISRPLYRIHGIGERSNVLLSEAISDLAHERWAASRKITPESWRSCADFLDERLIGDLTKMANSDDPMDRKAVALVVGSDESNKLDDLQAPLTAELEQVSSGELTWHTLGKDMEELLVRKSLT